MAKPDGGPAFPCVGAPGAPEDYPGMSLRDYFAGQAIAACSDAPLDSSGVAILVSRAYRIADAMLVERCRP